MKLETRSYGAYNFHVKYVNGTTYVKIHAGECEKSPDHPATSPGCNVLCIVGVAEVSA